MDKLKLIRKKIRYLRLSLKQWQWLAANPEREKEDYFNEHDIATRPIFDCYTCEFEAQGPNGMSGIMDVTCVSTCLLGDTWPMPGGCRSLQSQYSLWKAYRYGMNTPGQDRLVRAGVVNAASAIALGCLKAISKLKKEYERENKKRHKNKQ